MFVSFLLNSAYAEEAKQLELIKIDLYPNTTNIGSVFINWSACDSSDKIFKVYRSTGQNNFETISADYTQVNNVNCLQVYPIDDAKDQLKNWMDVYGKDIINVTSVSIEKFNNNAEEYLKDCDVVLFGTWDANNHKDLSEAAVQPLIDFINSGKGVIFGHDTIYKSSQSNTTNFNKFGKYAGVDPKMKVNEVYGTEVFITKTGLLTSYPWNLETGTSFNVPRTHCSGQEVESLENVNFFLQTSDLETNPNRSYYLTTKNNVAVIQTGHSMGKATEDEQKIITNLVFYCKQLVNTDSIVDYGANDRAPPKAPLVINTLNGFVFFSEDESTTYYYYVESYHLSNTTKGSEIGQSDVKEITIKTGVRSFRYIIDDKEDTVVTLINSTKVTNLNTEGYNLTTIITKNKRGYIHVAAVDGSDNISPTTTVRIIHTPGTCVNNKRNYMIMISSLTVLIFICYIKDE